jgi:RNA polymerase sigma-70 factor (ECF subfamily)
VSATVSSILVLDPAPLGTPGAPGTPGGIPGVKGGLRAPGSHTATVDSAAAPDPGERIPVNESAQWAELSDEDLLRRYCGANDQLAFRTLYGRHRLRLYRFVLRLSQDPHEAEEVFQETWMAVVKAKEHTTVRFAAYLFSIAHRRLCDRWRRRKRRSPQEVEGAPHCDPDEVADDLTLPPDAWAHLEQLRDALASELAKLPVMQREVFLMKAEAGLSLEEIAAIMGSTHEAVKSRLRYALGRLRAALGSWK